MHGPAHRFAVLLRGKMVAGRKGQLRAANAWIDCWDNGKAGIIAETRRARQIVGDRVEQNGDGGVCLKLGSTTKVEHNLFAKNKGVGLLVRDSQPASVSGNQFSENSDAALRNEGPNPIQPSSNWWGSTSERDVARMIQGRMDNPGWGEVEFRPWLAGPPAATRPAR